MSRTEVPFLSGAAFPTSSYGCRPRSPDLRWFCRRSSGTMSGVTADRAIRVTFDAEANAAYVYLQPPDVIQPSVAQTLPVTDSINLDFDDRGRLIGIEILAARTLLHAELLRDDTPR